MKEKKPRVADGQHELVRELAILRTRVDEIAEQFCLGVKARIDELLHVLGTAPEAGHVLPEPQVVEKMVQRMKRLKVKPQKGRAKDLKRIQDLVDILTKAAQGNS